MAEFFDTGSSRTVPWARRPDAAALPAAMADPERELARPKQWEVDDELWAVIEPLLPKVERRARHPGRKRHPDRLVFQRILFVLHTGIAWEHLPQELGFRSGMTCWSRLAEWTEAGCGPGCTRCSSPSCAARTSWSSKHHVITDATGIPLAATLTGRNRNDVTQLIPPLEAVPPVRGKRGRPRRRRMWCRPTAATTTTRMGPLDRPASTGPDRGGRAPLRAMSDVNPNSAISARDLLLS
ncbi:hypothetical protein GCM10010121_088950 [Streptomyces brasiliensis]|uniref:Insertion element IS402-like domain-containing protein n=1 Tax=Streptomyces brasiliensis TaxID=1954 RepID=A0A917UKQ0_9ACTN|nr:hypothetical protein GCM10010121_088950 [Streptomyces brasiliensis]